MNGTRTEVAIAPDATPETTAQGPRSAASSRHGFTAYRCPYRFTAYASPAPYDDWVSVIACREGERSGREIMRVQPVTRRYVADHAAIGELVAEARDETMPWWARLGFKVAGGTVRLLVAPLMLIGNVVDALGRVWWIGILGLPAALAFLFLVGAPLTASFAVALSMVHPSWRCSCPSSCP